MSCKLFICSNFNWQQWDLELNYQMQYLFAKKFNWLKNYKYIENIVPICHVSLILIYFYFKLHTYNLYC